MLRHMRTTVRLPDELLRKAKKKASEKGETLTSLIEQGLNLVLAEPRRPRQGSRVLLPVSKSTGGTLPGVDLNRSADLEDRMDSL
ncbi:MAG TPA: hypothetical protein VJ731_15750 [Terriglobales bacterium]|nr:hypothetical protein [Terriglobales bacterium]